MLSLRLRHFRRQIRESAAEVVNAILSREPAPLRCAEGELPAELERLVMKALRKDAAARYQTCAELQAELRALRDNVETAAKLREHARRNLQEDDLTANPLLSEFEGYPKLQKLVRLRPHASSRRRRLRSARWWPSCSASMSVRLACVRRLKQIAAFNCRRSCSAMSLS